MVYLDVYREGDGSVFIAISPIEMLAVVKTDAAV